MKRPPIWTSMIPLAVAGVAYHHWWSGKRDAFAAEVAAAAGPAAMSGFPYRLEADLGAVDLNRTTADASARLRAGHFVLNRQLSGSPLVVGYLVEPQIELSVPAVPAAQATIGADAAQSSLRMEAGHVARLSTVFDKARIGFGGLAGTVSADSFETHLRETPNVAQATANPRFPVQDELVLAATGLRYAGGDPLTFAANIDLTACRAVRALGDWRPGGTAEVRRFTLADRHGEVLSVTATLSPDRSGAMLVSGTLATVCPGSAEALAAGLPTPKEFRTRRPVRYSFTGPLGSPRLTAVGATRVPVRNQEPPCPVLRR